MAGPVTQVNPHGHAELRSLRAKLEHVAVRSEDGESAWFIVAAGSSPADVAAASRAVLTVLRNRLQYFGIDARSDAAWPPDVLWAVDYLDARRASSNPSLFFGLIRRDPSITVELDLANAHDFDVVLAVAPYTIGCIGLNENGRPAYSVNDTGTSAAFRLTATEVEQVRHLIESADGDPATLVPMSQPA